MEVGASCLNYNINFKFTEMSQRTRSIEGFEEEPAAHSHDKLEFFGAELFILSRGILLSGGLESPEHSLSCVVSFALAGSGAGGVI